MKLKITHLKAPWPEGACVGDVVEVGGPLVPGWAAGKCHVTDEPVTLWHGTATGDGSGESLQPIIVEHNTEEQQAADALAAAEAQAAEERQDMSRAAMVAALKAKGVKVDGRWSEARLAEELAKAEK